MIQYNIRFFSIAPIRLYRNIVWHKISFCFPEFHPLPEFNPTEFNPTEFNLLPKSNEYLNKKSDETYVEKS